MKSNKQRFCVIFTCHNPFPLYIRPTTVDIGAQEQLNLLSLEENTLKALQTQVTDEISKLQVKTSKLLYRTRSTI
jgi:hypothetical protein